jgi:ketosteroid isomerase-like protein
VATIRALFDEFGRRETAVTFRVLDEQVTWDARRMPVEDVRRVFHGHDGVRQFWRTWLEAWEGLDIIDGPHHHPLGNQVVTWWRQRNRGRTSGVPLEMTAAFVWTFQNDRIVRAALFASRDEAFRAAGLEP